MLSTFDPAPIDWHDEREHRRKLAETVNGALGGKTNNLVEVTLTASASSTTIENPNIGPNTVGIPVPVSETAGGEVGMWQTTPNAELGKMVINHGVDSRTDRNFVLVLVG